MRPDLGFLYLVFGIVLLTVPTAAQDPDLNGVRLALDQYDGPAKVFGKIDGPFRLRIEVERNGERKKLGLRVKLPVAVPSEPFPWRRARRHLRQATLYDL